jgi:hypothetical protein
MIVQAQRIGGGVGRLVSKWPASILKMRVHGFDLRRRDVGPFQAAVGGDLNQAVAGARPQHVHVERRWRKRRNRPLRRDGVTVDAYLPALAGMSHVWRVRSPLMAVQLCPPLVVFHTPAVA